MHAVQQTYAAGAPLQIALILLPASELMADCCHFSGHALLINMVAWCCGTT